MNDESDPDPNQSASNESAEASYLHHKSMQRDKCIERMRALVTKLNNMESVSVHCLETRLVILDRQLQHFEDLQNELELADATQFEEDYRGQLEEAYCEAKFLIMERLHSVRVDETQFSSTRVQANEPPNRSNLPKPKLPTFDGNPRQWIDFHNMFQTLVHQQASLSPIEKFQYLRSCLTDSAAQLVHSLEVTGENYSKALSLLKTRYNNKRFIFQSHLNHIFDMQSVCEPTVPAIRQFIDTLNANLRALQSLATDSQIFDGILLHLVTAKLDRETQARWEEDISSLHHDSSSSLRIPTLYEFTTFLERRCQTINMLESFQTIANQDTSRKSSLSSKFYSARVSSHSSPKQHPSSSRYTSTSSKQTAFATTIDTQYQSSSKCPFCNQQPFHKVFQCDLFTELSPLKRYDLVKKHNLCLNCLGTNHTSVNCPLSNRCQLCRVSHHTLLHRGESSSTSKPVPSSSTPRATLQASTLVSNDVILATALVRISNTQGTSIVARALLDSASQIHFITEGIAQHLQMPRYKINTLISGIGLTSTNSHHGTTIVMKSLHSSFTSKLDVVIIPSITSCQPNNHINVNSWKIPKNINLADSKFNIPGSIDLLIGAELFYQLMLVGQIKLSSGLPTLQKTILGWVVAGSVTTNAIKPHGTSLPITTLRTTVTSERSEPRLETLLERFWKIENVKIEKPHFSIEEHECERYFAETTTRCPTTKKLIVRLPFKEDPKVLGESYDIAFRRLQQLENKLSRNKALECQYSEFMNEYIALGHMEHINTSTAKNLRCNYIPHHCVVKADSSTTKLRVVFDASCHTSSGKSINNILRNGPTLQDDLFTIQVRFRLYRNVLMADIAKMYRQIEVDNRDSHYQCILWRHPVTQAITTYKLKTVTYGTSSAPYLAVKCLRQLAAENNTKFPIGSTVTLRDFYVDNLMTGASTVAELLEIKTQVIELLKLGGFPLRKFASNNPNIISDIPENDREEIVSVDDMDYVKALGLKWSPQTDNFFFRFSSTLSQQIEPVSSHPSSKLHVSSSSPPLSSLVLPPSSSSSSPETPSHSSPTSSQPLQSQSLSLTSSSSLQSYSSSLQSSKSKVSKRTILSRISTLFDPLGVINPVIVSSKILMQELWKLKLDWDESVPQSIYSQWQTILERLNLISTIQLPRYVPFNANSKIHAFADASMKAYGACIYVAIEIDSIQYTRLLRAKSRVAPTGEISLPRLELCAALLLAELLQSVCNILSPNPSNVHCWSDSTITLTWISSESSRWNVFIANRVSKIQQITSDFTWHPVPTAKNPADIISRGALVYELSNNKLWFNGPEFITQGAKQWPISTLMCSESIPERRRRAVFISTKVVDLYSEHKYINNYPKLLRIFSYVRRFIFALLKKKVHSDYLTPSEILDTQHMICRRIQQIAFADEYKLLKNERFVNRCSKILQLSPFLLDDIIRVGGRIQNSSLPFDSKHPILLPHSHPFVTSLIAYYHRKHLHAGCQTLINILRDNFWIINAKNAAREVVHSCIMCYRCRPITASQVMGSLPRDRVVQTNPFETSGVDYCGPFLVTQQIRGRAPKKTYVALFICFTTKAVHLELVPDLSTNSFIAALKRFISRRGKCRTIYSDNATNFVGANRELQRLLESFTTQQHTSQVQSFCLHEGITWKFIPPRSPHFGGLWESAVKLAKHHLRRSIGTHILSQDELHTLCCQAEAMVNSRPLTPMSSNADDLRVLTPAHFLIGRTLTSIPEPSLHEVNTGTLKRYQRLEWIRQQFWKLWHKGYLTELQRKVKWTECQPNIKVNDMVLIKEDNTPPLTWSMGRIVEAIPGADNQVRVVVIKTANGAHKRAITKIAKLPIEGSC